ncbi:MAG: hypothetical protein ACOCW2_04610 [Chitinivibrionales bacterium]
MALSFIHKSLSMHINALPSLRLAAIGMISTDARGNLIVPDFSGTEKQPNDFYDRCLAGLLSLHGIYSIYLEHSVPQITTRLRQNSSLAALLEHFRADDKMTIHGEVLRLLCAVRDAAASPTSRVTISEKGLYLSHVQNGREIYLKADSAFVEKLLVLTIMLVQLDNRGGEYSLGLLRTFYNDLQKTINLFNNAHNSTLSPLSANALCLSPNRCRVQQPLFTMQDNRISIERLTHSFFSNSSTAPEYFIIVKGRQFVIPDEALVQNNSISMHDLSVWHYNSEIVDCMRQVKSFITLVAETVS